MEQSQRIGFVTCVELGLGCIEEALRLGGRFDLLVTLRDDRAKKKSGRVYLDEIAARSSTPLLKVRHINDAESIKQIADANLDWLFVVGWSQIADKNVLASVHRGCLGIHPTLLPKGRGRAAIPWAILKGLSMTGVTLFALDEGVDSGPIVAQVELPLSPDETASTLYPRVVDAHRELIRRVWPGLASGHVTLTPQDHDQATHWPGRKPDDGEISPDMTLAEVDRLVRATTRPYPGAFVRLNNQTYTIWSGSTKNEPTQRSLVVPCADGQYFGLDVELRETSDD